MNRVYVFTKDGLNEMYFAHATRKQETIEKDMREFEVDGWKFKKMFDNLPDERFYRVKFRHFYRRHVEYLDLYHKEADFRTSTNKVMNGEELVFQSAKALVLLANKIIDRDYDIDVPELVHQYINYQFYQGDTIFKQMVLS